MAASSFAVFWLRCICIYTVSCLLLCQQISPDSSKSQDKANEPDIVLKSEGNAFVEDALNDNSIKGDHPSHKIADDKQNILPNIPLTDNTVGDTQQANRERDFYSFTVVDINGNDVKLEKYRGMVSLVVNVASECGFTDTHYKELVKTQDILSTYKKFTVLAFPCNQFGAQEPADNADIAKFVQHKYRINFPLFSKINVLDHDVPAAWQYLIDESRNPPSWNFWKYLVNQDGHVVEAWGPWVAVDSIFHEVYEAVVSLSDSEPVVGDAHGEL